MRRKGGEGEGDGERGRERQEGGRDRGKEGAYQIAFEWGQASWASVAPVRVCVCEGVRCVRV